MSFDQGFRLHPEAAQRSMALSELDNISKALERSLDFWGVMLLLATALVVVGLVAEYWHDINKFWMLLRWPMALFPREELMRLVGGILVTIGIGGELLFTYRASRVETELRNNNHRIEALLTKEAGDPKISAEGAATAARQAKELADAIGVTASQARAWVLHLKPRYTSMDVKKFVESLKSVSPEKVEIMYEREDEEAYTLAGRIAMYLGHGEGNAGRDVSGPRPVTEKGAFKNLPSRYLGSHPEYIPLIVRAGGSGGAGIIVKSIPPNPGKGAIGASALLNALANSGALTVLHMYEEPSMPDGLIRIVIGKQFN